MAPDKEESMLHLLRQDMSPGIAVGLIRRDND